MTIKTQKLAILALFKQSQEPVSPSTLSQRSGATIAGRTLRRWLNQWVDEGVLERVGEGRATRYRYLAHEETSPSSTFFSLKFLSGLDADLRDSVMKQLRDLWTHNSTAIEGNTLSLGDTHFVLEEGLTISGKPLKDHQEVIGHARAIELIYQSLKSPLNESIFFELHKAVQTEIVSDIYKPAGAWKIEPNGTYAVTEDGQQIFIEYALPLYVPQLMSELIEFVNQIKLSEITMQNAPSYYAKVHTAIAHIHPFWDGNGRIARLVANIPLLKAGLPPLLIPQTQRREYIQLLANYEIAVGQLNNKTGLWPAPERLNDFSAFCHSAYVVTTQIIEKAFEVQGRRH
ncbi:MAG: Fic family protein [Gammaproteobacteria bacterium]|nr:Fic family protein [Gammaproteobacteria bacterium]